MPTMKRSLMAAFGGLVVLAGLVWGGALRAQTSTAPSKTPMGMAGKGNMGMMGMMGMMGPMNMAGTVTMNGKPYDIKCSMTPVGKSRMSMMRGRMGMRGMMNQPMRMSGVMAMMGQKYRCTIVMTPHSQGAAPAGQRGTR